MQKAAHHFIKPGIIITFICFGGFLSAQSHIGLRIGVTSGQQNIQIGDNKEELAAKLGADIALTAEIPLFFFTLNPEIHWLQKGGKVKDIHGSFGSYSRTFNYLEIPVLLRLNFGKALGFTFFGGPSFGYLLDGTDKDHDGSTSDIDLDFYDRTEYGAHFGAGIGFGPFRFDIRYIMGLTNIFEGASNIEILNKSWGAGAAIKF